jgi:hypothetical protein
MSSAVLRAPRPGLVHTIARVVDWRLVAAIGLPIWAFLLGVVVMYKPAPTPTSPAPTETAAVAPPAPAAEPIPAPREVVYRTEYQPVPVVVPVTTPELAGASALEPVEFKLPPSEVVPADRCQTYDTKIRFHAGLPEAAQEAKQSKKMMLVLHISGNFDDPGFT